MGESLDIDSPFRGWAMPRSYSGDLRERVIEAVEMEGASRREAAERFDISVSSAVKCSAGARAGVPRRSRAEEVCLRWKRMRSGYWLSLPSGRT
jgi:hypothetical protein